MDKEKTAEKKLWDGGEATREFTGWGYTESDGGGVSQDEDEVRTPKIYTDNSHNVRDGHWFSAQISSFDSQSAGSFIESRCPVSSTHIRKAHIRVLLLLIFPHWGLKIIRPVSFQLVPLLQYSLTMVTIHDSTRWNSRRQSGSNARVPPSTSVDRRRWRKAFALVSLNC